MNEIEEITRSLLQTKVIEALKSKDDYIESLVEAAFKTDVNEYGVKPDSWSKDKITWLEYCARDAIKKAAKAIVEELIEDLRPQIKEAVKKALTADDIVSAFTKKIVADTSTGYYVDITFKPRD